MGRISAVRERAGIEGEVGIAEGGLAIQCARKFSTESPSLVNDCKIIPKALVEVSGTLEEKISRQYGIMQIDKKYTESLGAGISW